MLKAEIIIAQAEEIAELRAKVKDLEGSYYNNIQEKATERKKAEELQKAYDRLLFEFSRALELIRGNGLNFESEIIEAETQKGAITNEQANDNG